MDELSIDEARTAAPQPAAHGGRRKVTVLGATGSVGLSTLDLVRRSPDAFEVVALTAGRKAGPLITLAQEFRPEFVAIAEPVCTWMCARRWSPLASRPERDRRRSKRRPNANADWVMAAIVGAAGLAPTLAAARRGATIALANKECLVCSGELLLKEASAAGARLLPVDSEHNAIFQVLDVQNRSAVEKLILTASGGPFRTASQEEMRAATPADACAHPNWDMGAKISVDSATMMNKGLELIEASYLFGFDEGQIDILVHPQSVIHSLVAYVDGSVLAQLGSPDMRTPIAHTLAWPSRMETPAARLDLVGLGQLTFEPSDPSRFPALRLARHCLQQGGAAPTVLNAANEVGVARFLGGDIGFLDIASHC